VYQVFIKATAEQIWDAITKPEWIEKYLNSVKLIRFTSNTLSTRTAVREELKLIRQRGFASSYAERHTHLPAHASAAVVAQAIAQSESGGRENCGGTP